VAGAIDELGIFDGVRPSRSGDLALESQGMAPVPDGARYGAVWRMFTVWFTPNMELSGVFAGTLAVLLGLGFWPGLVAIILGTAIGSVPVALLCTWGPQTGTGQVPLARLPFGKTIVAPATVQWLSSIAWDALVGLFGGQAAALLLGIPFWAGVALVLAVEGVVGVYGYEFVHRLQSWGAAVLVVLFVVLTVRIFQHHIVLPVNTVHGSALAGAFVLAAILWMHAADTAGRFENILLFVGYWIAPFCAIVMIDWHDHKDRYQPSLLRAALSFRELRAGWPALAAFVLAFAAMVPFMNTSVIEGPVARALHGADIAFYVGFIAAGFLYYWLRRGGFTGRAEPHLKMINR